MNKWINGLYKTHYSGTLSACWESQLYFHVAWLLRSSFLKDFLKIQKTGSLFPLDTCRLNKGVYMHRSSNRTLYHGTDKPRCHKYGASRAFSALIHWEVHTQSPVFQDSPPVVPKKPYLYHLDCRKHFRTVACTFEKGVEPHSYIFFLLT